MPFPSALNTRGRAHSKLSAHRSCRVNQDQPCGSRGEHGPAVDTVPLPPGTGVSPAPHCPRSWPPRAPGERYGASTPMKQTGLLGFSFKPNTLARIPGVLLLRRRAWLNGRGSADTLRWEPSREKQKVTAAEPTSIFQKTRHPALRCLIPSLRTRVRGDGHHTCPGTPSILRGFLGGADRGCPP